MHIANTPTLRVAGTIASFLAVAIAVPTVSVAEGNSKREPVICPTPGPVTETCVPVVDTSPIRTTNALVPSEGGQSTFLVPRVTSDERRPPVSDDPTRDPPVVTTPPPVLTFPPVVTTPPSITTTPPIITDPPIVTTTPPVITDPPVVTTTPPVVTDPPVVTTTPPVVTPDPPTQTPAALELSSASVDPGEAVLATGLGCAAGEPVQLSIEEMPVGSTVAAANGSFQAALDTGSVDVGRYEVVAQCGRTLTAPLEIVLVSHVGTGTSTVTLILIFLILGVWFYAHRLVSHLPERSRRD